MACHHSLISSAISMGVISIVEAHLGKRAKDGKSEYGSIMGAITFYLILPALVFIAGMIVSRRSKEDKK